MHRFVIAALLVLPAFGQEPPSPTVLPVGPLAGSGAQDSIGTKKDERFTADLLGAFTWRQIGPANMGGRITDLAVDESRPQHFFVCAASGGVWETQNNGTTWTPIFDKYGTSSIGDMDISKSNPQVLYVGTGESNARNSVTPGDGVYKSTDGGRTFVNVGLRDTRHIGRVIIHPTNPDTVWVAALGCVYKPSKERGLFKTTDGGKTWRCVKFIDEDSGFVELQMDPTNPDVLYAASFAVRRDAFSGSNSPSRHPTNGGIFKSTDGGETWTKLTKGLPKTGTGRIGLSIYHKDPRIVMAVVETKAVTAADTTPSPGGPYVGVRAEEQDLGLVVTEVTKDGPADKAGLQVGDVIKVFDGKKIETYGDFTQQIRLKKPDDKVKVQIVRAGEEKTIELTIGRRPEETSRKEISFQPPSPAIPSSSELAGFGAQGDAKQDEDAEKGGVYRSEDGGETWTRTSGTNPRPFYFSKIRIDPTDDKRVYVLGVNLHVSSDGGKRFSTDGARGVHSDHHAMWINPKDGNHLLLGTDGGLYISWDRCRTWEHINNMPLGQFYAVGLDMSHPYRLYGGLQDNGTWGGPSRSRDGAITNDEWSMVSGGDGFYARIDPTDPNTAYVESQYGMVQRVNLKTRESKSIRPRGEMARGLRWEWNTPIELSPHDPKCVYIAANRLFESADRGDTQKAISLDLCKTPLGSISVIGLSPVAREVIWCGTNDGGVWVTRDRGATWTDVTANVPGLPPLLWVTRVEASCVSAGAAYLTVEGRRKDDLRTYVWKTEDFGRTWRSLAGTLPANEPAYVIRQDRKNPNLLFVGTERSVYVSIDDGARWVSLQRNLPVVPVHDLAIHPRDGELVAATHGRSLWAIDVTPLQQMTPRALSARACLFEPAAATRWLPGSSGWFGGAKAFRGQNGPSGATIAYHLAEDASDVSLTVTDAAGKQVAKLNAPGKSGLHRVAWNLSTGGGGREGGGRGGFGGARAAPGDYWVVLTAHGMTQEQPLRVIADPAE